MSVAETTTLSSGPRWDTRAGRSVSSGTKGNWGNVVHLDGTTEGSRRKGRFSHRIGRYPSRLSRRSGDGTRLDQLVP